MGLKIYDADQILVNFAGVPVDSGYADGEFLRIEQAEDDFTLVMGTDGSGTRSKSNNRSATITLILMQSSQTNTALSALNNLDLKTSGGAGVGPLLIKDKSGTSLYSAAKCWISKAPNVSFDRTATSREWTLMTDNLIRLDGGN